MIEDNKELCRSLSFQLKAEGFEVDVCYDGGDALLFIRQEAHDLILLDRMLPGMDGLAILHAARKQNISTPVILLTALGELGDRIAGLDCGADDYIVKPFDFQELMARIRCILRRPRQWEDRQNLRFGDVSYDPSLRKMTCQTAECSLSRREGELLELFLRNGGQILPRNAILSRVWGPDSAVEDGNLDNYIHFLRRRLNAMNSRLSLRTVRSIGYRLEDTGAPSQLT